MKRVLIWLITQSNKIGEGSENGIIIVAWELNKFVAFKNWCNITQKRNPKINRTNIVALILTPALLHINASIGNEWANNINNPNTLAWALVKPFSSGKLAKTARPV